MNTENIEDLIIEAINIADKLENEGADEFTQWLGAFLHINKSRESIPEAEIFEAWQNFQAFKEQNQ